MVAVSRFFVALSILSCVFLGCNRAIAEEEAQDDSYFFRAIKAQKSGSQKEAEELFKKGSELSTTAIIMRRSFEHLIEIAASEEKEEIITAFLKKYDDDNAKFTAAKIWAERKDFAKIVEIAEQSALEESPNEFMRLYFSSFFHLPSDEFSSEIHQKIRRWFSCRPYSSEHQIFYQEYKSFFKLVPDENPQKSQIDENLVIMDFRNEIFRLSYGGAFSYLERGKLKPEFFGGTFSDEMLSDIGKACLYGSKDSYKTLPVLQKYVLEAQTGHSSYFRYFYTGRIFERAKKGRTAAADEYKKAFDTAFSEKTADNALWYYLNATLATSAQRALIEAEKYASQWHDAQEFDGFFDTLAIRFVAGKKWKEIYRAYENLGAFMSDEAAAQFAYLSARLIDTKRLTLSDIRDVWTIIHSDAEKVPWDILEVSNKAYRRALKSGIRPYYSVCAARWLDDDDILFSDIFYTHQKTKDFKRNIDYETLLLDYVKFDLIDEMYAEWLVLRDNISLEITAELSEVYQKSGSDSDNRYAKALRMVSYAANRDWSAPTKKAIEQLFPRNFLELVSESGAQFSVSEPLLFGLIKSESYFDPTVSSAAGASGLTQLMDSTAADVARKLKIQPYTLTDAQTNIQFGSYYISELIRRLNDSQILALFAYNGGITHVRNWLKSAKLEYGDNLPNDLFLEALPFAETREYGRKVVGAAAVYGYLYYGKSTASVVADIMN